MLQTLEGMFAKSTASERQVAITDLINTRMTGGRVKDHCLVMISHITYKLWNLLFKLILTSLPESMHPRFTGENLEKNKLIYARLEKLAAKHGCTLPQLALAWLFHQGGRCGSNPR